MPTIDSTLSVLSEIIITIRRLTNRPSSAQITDDEIKKYVNKFILYDAPAILNSLPLRNTFTFYLDSYIDTYGNDNVNVTSPFYNFNNKYITVNAPVYVGGYKMSFFEDRNLFNAQYQNPIAVTAIGTGDGVNATFAGTLSNFPVERNMVLFSSTDTLNNGVSVRDVPLALPGQAATLNDTSTNALCGVFNYVTGVYSFTFLDAPASGASVNAQVLPYKAMRPTAVLFYHNTFQFFPIPDQPYQVSVEVLQRPTEFLVTTDEPLYGQWGEFIAYGAAVKILQQSRDEDGAAAIMAEFKNQENLVRRKAIAQQTDETTSTIYDGDSNYINNTGWWYRR